METQNIQWKIEAGADGNVPDPQVTLCSWMETTRSIRKMVLFFTILVVINCVAIFLWLLGNALPR